MKKAIYIHKHLPSTVTSRQSIDLLRDELALDFKDTIIFDFADIDFISRAFDDELSHFITENNITAEFQHANPIISEMLEVVQKNRGKRNSTFHNIAITPFKDKKDFANFLSLL